MCKSAPRRANVEPWIPGDDLPIQACSGEACSITQSQPSAMSPPKDQDSMKIFTNVPKQNRDFKIKETLMVHSGFIVVVV